MPLADVGKLHLARQSIIGNRVLQEGAARAGVPSYIQAKRFVAKLWQPPLASSATSPEAQTSAVAEDVDGDVEMGEEDATVGERTDGGETRDKGKRSKKQRQKDELNTLWLGDKVRGSSPLSIALLVC